MIQAKHIQKKFGETSILKDVNLSISKGEIVSIVGASGAGKTTLLEILGTLSKPDQGSLRYDEVDISALNDAEISLFRNKHIGFIFQFHQLLPEFTAFENVCLPGFLYNKNSRVVEHKANELLNRLGLSHRAHHKPNELSGGEQQRVAAARALINNPKVVLADEPSGNLDSKNATELHQLFFELRKELNLTFVLVTHNEEFANMADRKLMMKDGCLLS